MANFEVIGSASGIVDAERLQNGAAAATNNGTSLTLSANRTTSGLTNVAAVAGIITDTSQAAYKGALLFSTADNAEPAERMRIDRAGNVGIGTASPQGALHVTAGSCRLITTDASAGTNNKSFDLFNASAGLYLRAVDDAGTAGDNIALFQKGSGTSHTYTALFAGNTEVMRIASGGKVGIGTSSPTAKLQIGSTAAPTPTYSMTNNGEGILLNYGDDSPNRFADVVAIGNTPAGATMALRFWTNQGGGVGAATEKMRIAPGGNVGINTTSPGSTLHVNGGVQVGSSPGGGDKGSGSINVSGDIYKNGTAYTNPDYVFDHHYEGSNDHAYRGLVPLRELEATIRQTRHLPGIGREPMGLFGRHDILLEKLEEAYLYIIELTKRVERLETSTTQSLGATD
jgi:hypothetical protein